MRWAGVAGFVAVVEVVAEGVGGKSDQPRICRAYLLLDSCPSPRRCIPRSNPRNRSAGPLCRFAEVNVSHWVKILKIKSE